MTEQFKQMVQTKVANMTNEELVASFYSVSVSEAADHSQKSQYINDVEWAELLKRLNK